MLGRSTVAACVILIPLMAFARENPTDYVGAQQQVQTKSPTAEKKRTGPMKQVPSVQFSHDLRTTIVLIEVPLANGSSVGSGFWVDKRHVATCWHVVRPNPTVTFRVASAVDAFFDLAQDNVAAANWQDYEAKLVAKDEANDLALLEVNGNPFDNPPKPAIKLAGKDLTSHYAVPLRRDGLPQPGEEVFLAGYPLGGPYAVVQKGIVASIAYQLPGFGPTVKILLSLVANPGNSGGSVFDSDGKVVGLLEGALPSRPEHDAALAVSGIAVVIPVHYLSRLMAPHDH